MNIETAQYKTSFLIFRHFRKINQQEAATLINISTSHLYKIEQGLIGVSDDKLLEKFGKAYSFRPEAFLNFKPSDYRPVVTTINFRVSHKNKKSVSPQKRLDELDALANVIRWRVGIMLGKYTITTKNSVDLERLQKKYKKVQNTDISGLLFELRNIFQLKLAPIQNVVKIAENLGIFVVLYDAGDNIFESFDGFSTELSNGQPLIVINAQMPADRIRLTVAHELSHVIMHKFVDDSNEKEAWKFAAELLLPEDAVKKYLENLTLNKLFLLKKRWMVSMGSLIMRAKDLNCISQEEYRRLWEMMSRTGFRFREPDSLEPPLEKPELLQKLIQYRSKSEPGFDLREKCFIASDADYTAFNFDLEVKQPDVLNL